MSYDPFKDPDLTPPQVTKADVQAQQQSDVDSTGPGGSFGHLLDVISQAVSNVPTDTAGFLQGIIKDAPGIARNIVAPGSAPMSVPGMDESMQEAQTAHDKALPGDQPTTRGERYAASAARMAGDALALGPEAPLKTLASGVSAGLGAQAGQDLAPDHPELGSILGMLAGAVAPEIGLRGLTSIQNARIIGAGAGHPDFSTVVQMVEDREGGGTYENPKVNPKSGAMGPMQVTPETARDPGYGIRPWDGKSQADLARVGRQKLAALMGKYDGDTQKAMAAYNWGEGHVDAAIKNYGADWLDHAPAETQHYVENVSGPTPRGSTGGPVAPMDPADIAQAMGDQQNFQSLADVAGQAPENNVVDINQIRHDSSIYAIDDGHSKAKELYDAIKSGDYSPDEAPSIDEIAERLDHIQKIGPSWEKYPEAFQKLQNTHDLLTDVHNMLLDDYDASVPNYGRPPEAVDARTLGRGSEVEPPYPANRNTTEAEDMAANEAFHNALNEYFAKNASSPDQRALDDLHSQWEDLVQRMRSREISLDEYDHQLKPVQQAIEAINRRIDQNYQEYDASAKTTPVDNTGYEKHTPYVGEPSTPANDVDEVERDTNPPAASSSFGTKPARPMPPKSPEGHPEEEPGATPPVEDTELTDKLANNLKTAKPLRSQQESMYTAERAKRLEQMQYAAKMTSGEARAHARLSALGGELPKVSYEGIKDKFTQPEIDRLHDMIEEHPRLGDFDKVHAETGLRKMLEGQVPTHSELRLLNEVFPDKVMKAVMDKRPLDEKITDVVLNASSLSRALRASGDLSAPLRQGINLIGTKAYWKSFVTMFKAAKSRDAFEAVQNEIASRSTYPLMKKAGLSLTNIGRVLEDREEMFLSKWAEKLPHVRHSEYAYTAFLNRLRADTFDSMIKDAYAAGIDFRENPKALRDIGNYINNATGRGDLGSLASSYKILNATFFSPRLIASRARMLNPVFYIKMNPMVRNRAIKDWMKLGGIAATTLGLAKMGGADVETDPRSSDWGKIKIGNTRFDPYGGYQQYVHLGYVLAVGQKMSPTTGNVTDLTSGKYGQAKRFDAVMDFFRNKESPMAGIVDDLLSLPKDRFGQKITPGKEVINLFVPMVEEDIRQAWQDNKTAGMIAIPAATFGAGVQTFQPNATSKSKGSAAALPGYDPFSDKDLKSISYDPFTDKDLKGV